WLLTASLPVLSENHIRTYWWCSPDKIQWVRIVGRNTPHTKQERTAGATHQKSAVLFRNHIGRSDDAVPTERAWRQLYPYRWIARPSGASLCSDKCVRDLL